MFNKFILSLAGKSKKYITISVLLNIFALLLNLLLIAFFVYSLQTIITTPEQYNFWYALLFLLLVLPLRFFSVRGANKAAYLITGRMKGELRSRIFNKNLNLKKGGLNSLRRAELTQLALEGVEQTEMYTSVFIPQFFYALSSVLIVFTLISFISWQTGLVLLLCIPLIPMSVLAVVKFAKRLFSKYWGNYTNLGGDFLDATSGMTTLKIYNADNYMGNKISKSAERFRKITMKVLSMQLNSITVMDAIAFGGAALAMSVALGQMLSGTISVYTTLFVTLIAAEFFLPLRALGSAFHVAMNGITAAKKIEGYLNLPEEDVKGVTTIDGKTFTFNDVTFAYNDDKLILQNFNFELKQGSFVALIGDSGSGKSTIANLLTGFSHPQEGNVFIDTHRVQDVDFKYLNNVVRRVSYDSRIFKGSIRSNLLLAKMDATEAEVQHALKMSALTHFSLDYELEEGGNNLSGGERQRLALARIFLTKAKLYIFDEALSNIDGDNEAFIMETIFSLKKEAAVLFITHRFTSTQAADQIYVLNDGQSEVGTHESLMNTPNSVYSTMYLTQEKVLQEQGETQL